MDDDEQGAEVLDQAEKEQNHDHFYNYLERYLQFKSNNDNIYIGNKIVGGQT